MIRRFIRIKILKTLYSYNFKNYMYVLNKRTIAYYLHEIYYIIYFFLNIIIKIKNNINIKDFIKDKILNILNKNINKKYNFNNNNNNIINLINDLKTNKFYNKYIRTKYYINNNRRFLIKLFKFIFINKNITDFIINKFVDYNIYSNIFYNIINNVFKYIYFFNNEDFIIKYCLKKSNINFLLKLYYKTIIYNKSLINIINKYIKDYKIDLNIISIIDLIILKMAICELKYIKDIPYKVTINEYLEITKLYSIDKSKIMLNSILNKIHKDLEQN